MYTQKPTIKRISTFLFTGLFAAAILTSYLAWLPRVEAASGQVSQQQITLNPGGGVQADGSDGMRFTINSDHNTSYPSPDYAGTTGQDGVVYRNTFQYCCTAGAPMLNIGGTLYGQAGPASSAASWSSIDIVSTSGNTSVGARTTNKGNSSATVRYTAVKNSLNYTIERTVSYTYPNDYVTETYTFTIPDGNNETVKFYLGGDTAPGSSDSGYGVMLTEPVRSVISLNTSSHIMFGFREVPGSKPFDGATSQSYSAPYGTVGSGGNIGFVGTTSGHDAGLMMQWNLGSTPGTQTASMEQFASTQGTNLNAAFSADSTDTNSPVDLNISIVNTELISINSLNYTITLPAGLVVGSGSPSNSCNGSVSATAGGNTITLTGGSVNAATNCVASVPVVSSSAGVYTISASRISGLNNLTNNVGTSSLTVSSNTPATDLNNDTLDDSSQPNVHSYTSSVTDKTVVLEVDNACEVDSASSAAETSNSVADSGYNYVNGLMNFTVDCGTPGYTTTVKQFYYDVSKDNLVLRKYNPNTNSYSTIASAALEQTTINGRTVTIATYQVTDGDILDTDQTVNGQITDPAGLAVATVGAPNTGLGGTRK